MKAKNLVMSLTLTTLSGLAMAQVPTAPATPNLPAVPATPAVPAEPHSMPVTAPTAPQAPMPVATPAPHDSETPTNTDTTTPMPDSLADNHFDNAVAAVKKGDTKTSVSELKLGISNLKNEVKNSPGSLKDKILGQSSALEKLLPLAQTGGLKVGVLEKAAGLAKLGLAHQRVEKLLGGGGSLLTKLSPLTSSMKGLGGAMSILGAAGGGGTALLSGAMSGLNGLKMGGPAAASTEPAVKGQISKVLDFVKGSL